ncbi:MAG: NAD(P)-dependent oxidoreductase [Betaproteobacteria bacterium]|nr:NAD(P)-dependent oxidoreductase [Betaproteobacteria bacterium]
MKLAFLGLGVMGYPMAGHLQAKGHSVTVYNRTTAKAEAWAKQYGGAFSADIAGAVAGAEMVMMCVGNDNDLMEVGQIALAAMPSGTILVDHTTASADVARTLFKMAAAKGIGFIDAPVSGGQAGAVNGQLTVMCGGDQATFDKAKPVMDCFAKATTLLGASGAGQLTKRVNQICIAGLVQALSEGLAFAEKAGLDGNQVLDVISKGAAQSWQMENRGRTMLKREFNFGFAVDWMRKDLGIVLDEARRNGARVPVTALVDQFYGDVQKAGGHRFDTSSLITRL